MSHRQNHPLEHDDGKDDKTQAGERGRQAFVIAHQTTESSRPGEAAFDHPAARQENEAAFGGREFHDLQLQALSGGRLSHVGAGVALVHVRHFDRLAGRRLQVSRQRLDLGPVLLIGGCDAQRQQIAKRVDGGMDCGARSRLAPSYPARSPLFGAGLQRAAVQDRRGRLRLVAGGHTQQFPHIMRQSLENARLQPALSLVVDRKPRRRS